jgi:hypothetical protein
MTGFSYLKWHLSSCFHHSEKSSLRHCYYNDYLHEAGRHLVLTIEKQKRLATSLKTTLIAFHYDGLVMSRGS